MVNYIVHWFKSVIANIYWRLLVGMWGVRPVFNAVYSGQPRSKRFRDIYVEVFGPEFAEEADPCGFLTLTDLRNIAQDLGVAAGQTFVDLACGRGGAALWIARETGASAHGIDIAEVAIEEAKGRVADFGVNGRATFQAADIATTGLADAAFDGAMSIDALFLVPDKIGAFREAARLLKPGAAFAFTTWEVDEPNRVKDYRPLLERFGMRVEKYEECPGWKDRQRGIHERVLENREQLEKEMGKDAAAFWIAGAQHELPRLEIMRRIYVVARKQ